MASTSTVRHGTVASLLPVLLGGATILSAIGCGRLCSDPTESRGTAGIRARPETRPDQAAVVHPQLSSNAMGTAGPWFLTSIWGAACTIAVSEDDPVPVHDVFFTYTDIDTASPRYFWMNTSVGRGSEGFARILENLRVLDAGTRVLIYPMWLARRNAVGGFLGLRLWNAAEEREMIEVAEAKGLLLILSPKDHWGVMRPEPRGGYLKAIETDGGVEFQSFSGFFETVRE